MFKGGSESRQKMKFNKKNFLLEKENSEEMLLDLR